MKISFSTDNPKKFTEAVIDLGYDIGWADGYEDVPYKKINDFEFPADWTEEIKQFFYKGYDNGFSQGSKDC